MELGGSSLPAFLGEPGPVRPPPARHVVVIASGKGGVGKSTVSLNLALALADKARAVGLLDADVYAPDLPVMVNLTRRQHKKSWLIYRSPGMAINLEPGAQGPRIERSSMPRLEPVERFGIKLMSAGFFLGEDQALSLPASSAYFILSQLAGHVAWGDLDYLVVDLPPGTADIQQHVISLLEPSGALIVVSPQDLAHLDAKKVISMFRDSNVPVLGGIENMGPLTCPHCEGGVEVFPPVRDSRAIWSNGVAKLVELPFDPGVARFAEQNRPLFVADPHGEHAGRFRRLGDAVADALEGESGH